MTTLNLRAATVDLDRGVVRIAGAASEPLTPQECALLAYLAARPGAVVPREELLREVWGYSPRAVTRAVDVAVRRLRQKVEADPSEPDHVLTERGAGYRFEPLAAAVAPPPATSRWLETALIGRGAEIADVRGLSVRHRVVGIGGAPGIGKTRVAVAAVGGAEGAVLVTCGGRDAGAVLGDLAIKLGIQARDHAVDAIASALSHRPGTILVLDGVEHLTTELGAWLAAWGPTSDARFLLVGQRLPEVAGAATVVVEGLPEDDAIALLLERARAVAPGWEASRGHLVDLVARLDHHPLAIELAASRASVLGASDLLTALAGPSRLLAGLDDAIAWSCAQLDSAQAEALRQCAVFEGAFDHEDAERVVDLSAHPDAPWVVDWLHALVGASLVRVRQDAGHRRYRLPLSIRAHLRSRGLDGALRTRHARAVTAKAEAWVGRLDGPERAEATAALRGIAPDLLVVCRGTEGTVASRAAAAWALHRAGLGSVVERREAVRAALQGGDDDQRGRLTVALAELALLDDDWSTAERLAASVTTGTEADRAQILRHEILLDRGRRPEDPGELEPLAERLWEAGTTHLAARAAKVLAAWSDADRAEAIGQRIVDRGEAAGDPRIEALGWSQLAYRSWQRGRLTEAVGRYQQALELARLAGLRRDEALALQHLGSLEVWTGNPDGGEIYLQEALRLHRESGERKYEVFVAANLGRLHLARGDLDGALPLLEASVRGGEGAPDDFLAIRHGHLGLCHLLAGRTERALRSLGRAATCAERRADPYLLAFTSTLVALARSVRGDADLSWAPPGDVTDPVVLALAGVVAAWRTERPWQAAIREARAAGGLPMDGVHPMAALLPGELAVLLDFAEAQAR
ncbi:MAG: winged helix-turn-helix domain-containing protein [Alphaproteobacteria bacterium]|nr:winged helix-turn-helix domain-containing protein [Alphaproteobacteria bacterium]MCB9695201.1 winged helix-turn-helix domain-containing protein [Alphaproteobacteria bacterium]